MFSNVAGELTMGAVKLIMGLLNRLCGWGTDYGIRELTITYDPGELTMGQGNKLLG